MNVVLYQSVVVYFCKKSFFFLNIIFNQFIVVSSSVFYVCPLSFRFVLKLFY